MRASGWSGRALTTALVVAAAATSGCKSVSERYIALEVWKYERCFGHLPPGFTPPGAQPAAAMPGRVCGQAQAIQPACQPMETAGCNDCGGGIVEGGGVGGGGMMSEGGIPMAAPPPAAAGVTAGRPVVISDELVVP